MLEIINSVQLNRYWWASALCHPLGSGDSSLNKTLALLLWSLQPSEESWIWKGCFKDEQIRPREVKWFGPSLTQQVISLELSCRVPSDCYERLHICLPGFFLISRKTRILLLNCPQSQAVYVVQKRASPTLWCSLWKYPSPLILFLL